jgi:hypothetical protein
MGRPRKRQFIEVAIQGSGPGQNNGAQELDLLSSPVHNLDYNVDSSAALYLRTGQPPPINFEGIDLGSGENGTPSFRATPQPQACPTITDGGIPPSTGAGPCSCLASIYLSLAALQQFPSDIGSSLKTVRQAASIALQAIFCPQCGSFMLIDSTPPIESFQNTMLLGTLLPIIAHGYQRLLEMVDSETDAATAANQTKMFSLDDYRGLCGRHLDPEDAGLSEDSLLNNIEMSPAQWRASVRALLRADIYGHESPGCEQRGLKDLARDMEYRQIVRHQLLDAARDAGTLDARLLGHGFYSKTGDGCNNSQGPGCLMMIKMAINVIDQILIA